MKGEGRVEMIQGSLGFTVFVKLYHKCPGIGLRSETISKEAVTMEEAANFLFSLYWNYMSQILNKFSRAKETGNCALWET